MQCVDLGCLKSASKTFLLVDQSSPCLSNVRRIVVDNADNCQNINFINHHFLPGEVFSVNDLSHSHVHESGSDLILPSLRYSDLMTATTGSLSLFCLLRRLNSPTISLSQFTNHLISLQL